MSSIVFILVVLSIGVMAGSFLAYKGKLKSKDLQINELQKQVQRLRDQVKNVNKRQGYRLDIPDEECNIEFIKVAEPSLQGLKKRKGMAKVKDISVSGMRISCNFDLPLTNDIIIKIDFKLQMEWFSLQALLIRKEKHINSPDVIYGIQFIEMSTTENTQLLQCLKSLEIERRNKLA